MLPNALNGCPKCNKSPNLVTLNRIENALEADIFKVQNRPISKRLKNDFFRGTLSIPGNGIAQNWLHYLLLLRCRRRCGREVDVVSWKAEFLKLLVGEAAGGWRLDIDLDLNCQRRGGDFPLTSGRLGNI